MEKSKVSNFLAFTFGFIFRSLLLAPLIVTGVLHYTYGRGIDIYVTHKLRKVLHTKDTKVAIKNIKEVITYIVKEKINQELEDYLWYHDLKISLKLFKNAKTDKNKKIAFLKFKLKHTNRENKDTYKDKKDIIVPKYLSITPHTLKVFAGYIIGGILNFIGIFLLIFFFRDKLWRY